MAKQKKKKTAKKILIFILILLLLVIGVESYLLIAKDQNLWPYFNAENTQEIKEGDSTDKKNSTDTVESSTTDTDSEDTFDPEKSPIQYESQSDNSRLNAETAPYHNEQFRIPEGEE